MSKRKISFIVLVLIVVMFPVLACSDDDKSTSTTIVDVEFTLPSLVEIAEGGSYTFTASEGLAALTTDSFILENTAGVSYFCTVTESATTSFTVKFPATVTSSTYTVYIKRNDGKKSYGSTYISIVDIIEGLELDESTTVYGLVKDSEGNPLGGVVVSDGIRVTLTDEDGVYQLDSDKERGYVFISVPSGYDPATEGILPKFYYLLKSDSGTVERADFTLTANNAQESFKVFMLGDMHLAKRTKDLAQFEEFVTDLNSYMISHAGETMYALTLGDMTWDLYWYTNNFTPSEYLELMNGKFNDLMIYHTMGNHDNDYLATSDLAAEDTYIQVLGPNYFSFNIGRIHFVVLDDIDCSSYDGTTSRNYSKWITTEQLEWLEKDLSYVATSTPIILSTHAQIFYPTSSAGFSLDASTSRTANTETLLELLSSYTTHIVTGHTHLMFNVVPDDSIVSGQKVYEHNSGSICGSWWWSDYLTDGVHIGQDGSPGGYGIWDISGTDISYIFKATGYDEDFQFRCYDLNNVCFTDDDVPDMPSISTITKSWANYTAAYPQNSDNEVLINIWNWNSNWTLSVEDENGNNLTPTQVWVYDPLHIAALTVPRFNSSTITSVPNFITVKFGHFFKVTAADADVDLTITVTDDFGNVYTQTMSRPMAFSTDVYAAK